MTEPRRYALPWRAQPRDALLGVIAAITTCGVVLVLFCPHLIAWRSWAAQPEIFDQPETGRGAVALWQVDHLGEPVPNRFLEIQRWRLLGPAVARVFRLPPGVHLSLYPLGAFFAVWYAWRALAAFEVPPLSRLAGLTAITANAWFFTATGWLAFMDGWVALGLLGVAFSLSLWPKAVACLLLPWADDRFLIGLPAAVLLTQLPPKAEKQPPRPRPAAIVAAIGIPVSVFLGLRLVIERYCALNTFGSHPYPPILTHLSGYLFGLTCALRTVWLLVPVGLWLGWRQRPAIGIPLALVTSVSVAAASGLAYDVSRSGVVVMPLILWTIAAWPQAGFLQATEFNGAAPSSRLWFLRHGGACALWAIAAANLCLPAYHHTLNWSGRIRPLWTELRLLAHPPPRYDPMTYANAAVAQLDKGDPSAAAWLVSIAESLGCEKHVVETIRYRVRLTPPAQPTDTPGDGSKKSP